MWGGLPARSRLPGGSSRPKRLPSHPNRQRQQRAIPSQSLRPQLFPRPKTPAIALKPSQIQNQQRHKKNTEQRRRHRRDVSHLHPDHQQHPQQQLEPRRISSSQKVHRGTRHDVHRVDLPSRRSSSTDPTQFRAYAAHRNTAAGAIRPRITAAPIVALLHGQAVYQFLQIIVADIALDRIPFSTAAHDHGRRFAERNLRPQRHIGINLAVDLG